jgi:hypothetical protein
MPASRKASSSSALTCSWRQRRTRRSNDVAGASPNLRVIGRGASAGDRKSLIISGLASYGVSQKFSCAYCEKDVEETADYYTIAHYPKTDGVGPIRTVDEVDVFCSTDCLKKYASSVLT